MVKCLTFRLDYQPLFGKSGGNRAYLTFSAEENQYSLKHNNGWAKSTYISSLLATVNRLSYKLGGFDV